MKNRKGRRNDDRRRAADYHVDGRLRDVSSARRGVYLLPNLITSAGLFCGMFAIVEVMHGRYAGAALALIGAQVFDVLDGRVARFTNTTSRFGVEYDSLCDLVSFGVAPALLIYRWALMPWGAWGWLACALYVTCSALRLARYNTMIGTLPKGHFLGLPVPAASAMLASIVLMYKFVGRSGLPDKHVALLLVTYLLAVLMVSSIPYYNGKNLKLNTRQPLSSLVAGVMFIMLMIAAYPLVLFTCISIYVGSGPAMWAWNGVRGRRLAPADDAGDGAADTRLAAGQSAAGPGGQVAVDRPGGEALDSTE